MKKNLWVLLLSVMGAVFVGVIIYTIVKMIFEAAGVTTPPTPIPCFVICSCVAILLFETLK